jgi:glycosyltransferase involved in cell wall biosynthesis
MKLRLFYFAPAKSIHTVRWLSAFVGMGHEVHLATTDVDAGRAIPGVVVHDMNVNGAMAGPVRFIRRWKKVRDILCSVRPDMVHGHCISSFGGYAAYFHGYPLIMTPWGSDILLNPSRSRLQWFMTRCRLRLCDLVTVNSEHMKQSVIMFGVPEERIALIQWGVNVERIRSLRGSFRLQQIANVPPDAFVVLSTRWCEPIYNLETVLHAVPKVLSGTERKVCFVFIGGGSLQFRLESLAGNLGVEKQTRFTGSLAHEVLEECYGGADIYVSVPQSEGASVSLMEALAAGLPAVVSDVPSNREWVRDGWNGCIVPRGDAGALAEAVLRLVADEPSRVACGARGMELAAKNADHVANMRKMEGLYRALVRSKF